MTRLATLAALIVGLLATASPAQTTKLTSYAMKTQNFVATYIKLSTPGQVTIASQGDVFIGDQKLTNGGTLSLPAGTFVLRVNNGKASSLSVTGAAVLNTNSADNALAASDSYIANYRRGQQVVGGFTPGQKVTVVQKKNAGFSWGGSMHSGEQNNATIKKLFTQLFDLVVTGDAAMWPNTLSNMTEANAIAAFAKANGMDAKLHNLVWDSNVPSSISKTASGMAAALAKRVNLFIGTETSNFQFADIYNELHQHDNGKAVDQIVGDAGVKTLYQLAHTAAAGKLKIETNNYSVLQYGGDSDAYVKMVKALAPYVDMAGAQLYVDQNYNLATSMQLLQNIDTIGLPIPLNEFGVQSSMSASQSPTIVNNLMRLMFGNANGAAFINWYPFVENGSFAPNSTLYDKNFKLTATGQMWLSTVNSFKTQTTVTAGADGNISFSGYYGDYALSSGSQTYNLTLAKGGSGYRVGSGPSTAHATPEPSTLGLLISSLAGLLVFLRGSYANHPRLRRGGLAAAGRGAALESDCKSVG